MHRSDELSVEQLQREFLRWDLKSLSSGGVGEHSPIRLGRRGVVDDRFEKMDFAAMREELDLQHLRAAADSHYGGSSSSARAPPRGAVDDLELLRAVAASAAKSRWGSSEQENLPPSYAAPTGRERGMQEREKERAVERRAIEEGLRAEYNVRIEGLEERMRSRYMGRIEELQNEAELADIRAERALDERDVAVAALNEDHHAAQALLADATDFITHLKLRNQALEAVVEQLLAERSSPQERPKTAAAPGFGMTHTRDAIRAAVKEAAGLPEAERRKKIRALRLKWHPDKHEVLQEMATEVTKMINEAVEAIMPGGGAEEE